MKKIVIQHTKKFENYGDIDHALLNKIIYDVGKLKRAHPTLRGHFDSAYLVGRNMLRAYLFFIYGFTIYTTFHIDGIFNYKNSEDIKQITPLSESKTPYSSLQVIWKVIFFAMLD